jgi:LacI family transcriptional regulator
VGCYGAIERAGLECPTDLSVVGFNDMPFIDRLRPPLTTVSFPHYQVGTEAGRLILERIAANGEHGSVHFLEPQLVIRGSTGPP